MVSEVDANKQSMLSRFIEVLGALSSVVTMVGLGVAYIEYAHHQIDEKRRIAIEATAVTVTPKFLKSYRDLSKLRDRLQQAQHPLDDIPVDEFFYVMNTYDRLGYFFTYNIGDRCIIKESMYEPVAGLMPLVNMIEADPGTSLYRAKGKFKRLFNEMGAEKCG